MNKAKAIKIVSIILMVSIFTLFLATKVFAAADIIQGLEPTYEDEAGLTNVGQQIISIISTVAIVISVIVLLIIGIKYMMGSASEKAEYKKTMIPYLIGVFIFFAITQLLTILLKYVNGLNDI